MAKVNTNLYRLYSSLNPVALPGVYRPFDKYAMRKQIVLDEMIEDYLIPKANIDSISSWKGIVLFVEKYEQDTIPNTSWAVHADYGGNTFDGYRVRVPELHSHLPLPKFISHINDEMSAEDIEICKMHPLFLPEPENVSLPANEDDIVLVEINNVPDSFSDYRFVKLLERSPRTDNWAKLAVKDLPLLQKLF